MCVTGEFVPVWETVNQNPCTERLLYVHLPDTCPGCCLRVKSFSIPLYLHKPPDVEGTVRILCVRSFHDLTRVVSTRNEPGEGSTNMGVDVCVTSVRIRLPGVEYPPSKRRKSLRTTKGASTVDTTRKLRTRIVIVNRKRRVKGQ